MWVVYYFMWHRVVVCSNLEIFHRCAVRILRQKCFIDVALSLFSHIVKLWPSRILMFVFSMPKNLAQVGTLCKTLELFTLIVSIPRQTLPMLIQHCLRPSTTIVNTSNHCVIGSPIIGNDINHRLGTLTIFVDYQNHYYNHCQLLPLVQNIKLAIKQPLLADTRISIYDDKNNLTVNIVTQSLAAVH